MVIVGTAAAKGILVAFGLFAAFAFTHNAKASPSLPTNLADCAITDIDPTANMCSGYWDGANDSVDLLNELNLFGYNDWQMAAYEDDNGIIDDFNINFDADLNQTIGTISMDSGLGGPELPLVLVLKSGNGFDAYKLNTPTVSSYSFELPQQLSHAGLYFRGQDTCCIRTQDIPNPTPIALLGAGLLGLGFTRKFS